MFLSILSLTRSSCFFSTSFSYFYKTTSIKTFIPSYISFLAFFISLDISFSSLTHTLSSLFFLHISIQNHFFSQHISSFFSYISFSPFMNFPRFLNFPRFFSLPISVSFTNWPFLILRSIFSLSCTSFLFISHSLSLSFPLRLSQSFLLSLSVFLYTLYLLSICLSLYSVSSLYLLWETGIGWETGN